MVKAKKKLLQLTDTDFKLQNAFEELEQRLANFINIRQPVPIHSKKRK